MRDFLRSLVLAAVLCAALLELAACSGEQPPTSPSLPNTADPQWVHQHDPHAKVALVFVHGIFGDTLGTWTSEEGTRFFDLIDKDDDLGPQVDILAFGYTSKMIGTGSFDIREAANRLHLYLDKEVPDDYPAIVFVAHSMGGLVVLRELLTHREMLERVPLIVLYATPQEGSQITTIARKIAKNPALEQMLPANRNAYLQTLDDDWKALGAGKRPPVVCAYEKQPTYGVLVVPWESATRFCDEPAIGIAADHLMIVKPDRSGHDSMVFLATKLKQYVLGKHLTAKLETPDFQAEEDHAVLTISDPGGKRDVRLVNAGGTKVRYTLEQFPDRWLYVIPGAGPDEIPPKTTRTLQFVLGYGAKDAEYPFLLTSDAAPSQKVVVRIPNLAAVQTAWTETALAVSRELTGALSDEQELERLKAAGPEGGEASERLAGLVKDSIAKRYPQLSPSGQWLLSADLLNSVNWPHLAVRALQNAERADQAIAQVPSVRRLASVSASLAGEPEVFANVDLEPLDVEVAPAETGTNPFAAGAPAAAEHLARRLQQVPSLAAQGFSLEGDLKAVRGDEKGALEAYRKAADAQMSPSIWQRSLEVRRLQAPSHDDPGAGHGSAASIEVDPSRTGRALRDSRALVRRPIPEEELEVDVRPP